MTPVAKAHVRFAALLLAGVALPLAMTAAPVPPVPENQAPPPRLVKSDLSLIYLEWLPGGEAPNRTRLWSMGFRNGKMLPPEQVWEGKEEFLSTFVSATYQKRQIVSDRLLVTESGGVIDLRARKVLSSEREGWTEHIDEKKVTYRIESNTRPEGLFTFEYATGTVRQIAKPPVPRPWHDRFGANQALSSDGKKTIRWEVGELILHREGEKPKSLGQGFEMKEGFQWAGTQSFGRMCFPVLWLDNNKFLTQRGHGKLVVVDLEGKWTEVVTLKDMPELATPSFVRDRSGNVYYSAKRDEVYKIDVAKKTAERSEWQSLGHGFEAAWKRDDKLGHKYRHNGKDIGQFHCWPGTAKTVPGYIALAVSKTENGTFHASRRVAVWSTATGEWATKEYEWLTPDSILGWLKDKP